MSPIRALLPRSFMHVVYSAECLEPPDLSDLEVRVVTPGETPALTSCAFLRGHVSRRDLWWLMRAQPVWVILAAAGGELCHYTFVTSGRRYRRIFPIMGAGSLLVGPCFTDERFRGRSVYPRILRHAVCSLAGNGHGPFFIHTSPGNIASIRGMEKAGFTRRGIWSGWRLPLNMWVVSRKTGD